MKYEKISNKSKPSKTFLKFILGGLMLVGGVEATSALLNRQDPSNNMEAIITYTENTNPNNLNQSVAPTEWNAAKKIASINNTEAKIPEYINEQNIALHGQIPNPGNVAAIMVNVPIKEAGETVSNGGANIKFELPQDK